MKKNELVHVHALLACVAGEYVERGVLDEDAFEAYRALGVSSMALRASRDDHAAAVRTLADTLSAAIAEKNAETDDEVTNDAETDDERTNDDGRPLRSR